MTVRTPLSRLNARVDSLLLGISESDLPARDRDEAIREAVLLYEIEIPRTAAVEFAGDAGAYYLMWGKAVEVATVDAGVDLTSSGAGQKLAVKFPLTRRMRLREVVLRLKRTGATVDGTLTGELFTDASNLPSASLALTRTVEIDETGGPPNGRYGDVVFRLDDPLDLDAGTYHLVLGSTGYTYADGVTEVVLGVQQASSPTNTLSTYNGSTWSAYGTASTVAITVEANTPGWASESASPREVEYPAADITANEQPQLLDTDQWEMYWTEDGAWLYFREHRPAATETVRVLLGKPFTWVEGPNPAVDIPPEHAEALCYLAASLSCERLATLYSQKRASTISADVAERRTQAENIQKQADRYRKLYRELVGMTKATDVGPSATAIDLDLEPPSGSFVFHGGTSR